jgi:pre-mRNA-splicing factor SYF1
MFNVYIAKAASNYGLPATRAIYERALSALPPGPTSKLCLRFASLERKLGEVDRARAVYAHGAQFADPRVSPEYWAAWNAFEVDAGSEETFREMLRIKRSVQAGFNTEASFLAAQAVAARKGDAAPVPQVDADPMAAAERASGKAAPAFVASSKNPPKPADAEPAGEENAEEIHISDDEDM